MRKPLALLIGGLAVFLASHFVSVSAQSINQPPLHSGLNLIQSDDNGVVIDLSTPDYTLLPVDLSIGKFDRLSVPDGIFTARSGYPQLPMRSAVLGVPPDARIDVQITEDDSIILPDRYMIAPAPEPAPLTDDSQSGSMRDVIDRAAYAGSAWYPDQPARIVEDAWLRDQRTIRVEFYPFQYRPDIGQLIWHKHLQVIIHFYRTNTITASPSVGDSPSPFESILRESLLNYEAAKNWRGRPAMSSAALRSTSIAASSSPSVKIVVDHDGIYRVTYAALQAAGVITAGLNPDHFSLTSQQQPVAIYVVAKNSGVFGPGDYFEFYGQKFRGGVLAARYADESTRWMTYPSGWHAQFNATMLEKYTDENVYWLNVDGPAGPRMAAIDGTPDGVSPTPTYFTTTVHAEQSNRWWTWHLTSEDTWFWDYINSPSVTTRTYTTTLSGVAAVPLSATIRGDVVARNFNPDAGPDHRTQFWLNTETAPVEDATWDGLTRHHFEAQVPQSDLHEGVNQLKFVMIPQPALLTDWIYFDWFEIQYARLFRANNDQLLFSDARLGSRQYAISNFVTSTLEAYDITNPLLPQRILSSTLVANGSSVTTTMRVSSTTPITYYVVGADMIQSPKRVTTYTPPDLLSAGNGADYIIITHNSFITASQTLANYRAAQGFRVKIVDVADLYNLFDDGIYNPIAIKNFLAYAYANWTPPAPAYVVLIGDGHWNFKGYPNYGNPPPIYMPPYLAFVDPWQGEVDSPNLLAAFVGSDILPDVSIGRIPVNSVAELNAVISKTIAYEQAGPQPYQQRSLFVAEITDGVGNFEAYSEDVISHELPSVYQADRIYIRNYLQGGNCPPACSQNLQRAITTTLNQTGTFLLNYAGHADITLWANESAFVIANISTLTNLNQLPIVLSMDCLDGYWLYPNYSSIMETMLRAPNGGAVATFSPNGLGVATGHYWLQNGFYDALFKNGVQRMGPATDAAKLNLYTIGSNLDLINTFITFGDPALRLPTYAIAASPGSLARFGDPGSVVTYTLQVTNLAYLSDPITLTPIGNAWPVTTTPTVVAPQSSADVVVSVTIPATAALGVSDIVSVTIASHGDAAPSFRSILTTTVGSGHAYSLSKSDAPDPVQAGSRLVYTLTWSLSGHGTATSAVITDALPTNTTFVSCSDGCTQPAGVVTWNLGDQNTGASGAVTVAVNVASPLPNGTVLTNNARISDSNSGVPSVASAQTTVSSNHALNITAFGPASVSAGEKITYTMRYTVTGNELASGVTITDAVPTNTAYVSCLNGCSQAGGMVTWMLGDLAPGNSGTVQFTVQVTSPLPSFTVISNTVRIFDANRSAASSTTATVDAIYGVNLFPAQIQKTGYTGQVLTYTLRVTNTGNITDDFSIGTAGYANFVLTPTIISRLPASASRSIWLTMTLPGTTAIITPSVTLTVTSQAQPSVWAAAELSAVVQPYQVFLPITLRQ